MFKILQTGLQHYVNWELQDVEAGFQRGRGTRDQIANILWIMGKTKNSKKKTKKTSASLTTLKPLSIWITTSWNVLKKIKVPDHLTCLLRNLCSGSGKKLKLGMEKLAGSKEEKEYKKVIHCYPAYLISI